MLYLIIIVMLQTNVETSYYGVSTTYYCFPNILRRFLHHPIPYHLCKIPQRRVSCAHQQNDVACAGCGLQVG